VLHEASQEAYGGKLRGRADVIRRGAEPEIQDYKTGAVLDSQDGDIKRSYRVQMLLYAVLEHEDNGVWPLRATLIPLEGQPVSIDIDPHEARHAAESCMRALDQYNAAVLDGRPVADLGAASPQSCRFCPYAVRCPAFWDAIDRTWAEDGIRAIAGRLLACEMAELGTLAFKVEAQRGAASGEVWLYGLDPERFSAGATASPGEWLAATSLIGAPASARFRPSEQTRLVVSNGSA
jgi:PD-(D/E)XK nuclease superfamily